MLFTTKAVLGVWFARLLDALADDALADDPLADDAAGEDVAPDPPAPAEVVAPPLPDVVLPSDDGPVHAHNTVRAIMVTLHRPRIGGFNHGGVGAAKSSHSAVTRGGLRSRPRPRAGPM